MSTVVVTAPVTEVVVVGTKDVFVTTTPQNASSAGFVWPLAVKGVITGPYGELRSGGKRHAGVDIGVPVGTSIVAVKAGVVEEADYDSDYGYYVVINHGNGLKTRYAHNKCNTVSVGQQVSAGQLIALSGNTGRSTGPHLHFEVIVNGGTTNPGYYLDLN
ncbi:MAG: M23 family metallopeptidase [Clostridia bacterium]|nr:M23 family metallopeptidase [Clostridia bacterium]